MHIISELLLIQILFYISDHFLILLELEFGNYTTTDKWSNHTK